MTQQNKTVAIILGAWLFGNFVIVPLIGFIYTKYITKKRASKNLPRVPKGWQVYHSQSKSA